MESSKWDWVQNVLTVIAMVLLYTVKGVFLALGYVSKQLVKVADLGLDQLDQKKGDTNVIDVKAERPHS